jgi:hypothetical protein
MIVAVCRHHEHFSINESSITLVPKIYTLSILDDHPCHEKNAAKVDASVA